MGSIAYKNGRFFKGGRPLFIAAVDYQYYRDKREHWADRLDKLKAANANTITFYVPWRHHLQMDSAGRRSYDFTGRTRDSRDLATFLKLIAERDLYMIAKPGPFVHSELNIGGLPDIASPGFNPDITVARSHDQRPYIWEYDRSQLPSPFDETFDELAREWLAAVKPTLDPYVTDAGPLIAIQLNDETIFCTANNPPWSFGYDQQCIRFFQRLLVEKYGDIGTYNRRHDTDYADFDRVAPPVLPGREEPNPGPKKNADLLALMDWAEFHWRMRRDLYERYIGYLGIDLPYLTNYAGITPPIEENIPGQTGPVVEHAPERYNPVYADWWFAQNRIDADADVYEYGMISWLGVAAYDMDVFNRYINTARRAPGINMEENWGFAKLYDDKSKHPVIPFFQTLVSLAGGATGYVIFVGVSTDYWDDSLDRITKLGCPTFPSDAPIDEHGQTRPMYDTVVMLNTFFVRHGAALLEADLEIDVTYLIYSPYAAVSSWVPDEDHWHIPDCRILRCGYQGLEPFAVAMQSAGYAFAMTELEAATEERLLAQPALAIHSAFFMAEAEQEKLARYVEAGKRLFISGQLPTHTDLFEPCTRLRDAVLAADGENVTYAEENLFASGKIVDALRAAGIQPKVTYSENLRTYVYRNGSDPNGPEYFLFFFNFDVGGSHEKVVRFGGQTLELTVGSKTSGVVRIKDGAVSGYLVKGHNEVEGITDTVRIKFDNQVIEGIGDFSSETT